MFPPCASVELHESLVQPLKHTKKELIGPAGVMHYRNGICTKSIFDQGKTTFFFTLCREGMQMNTLMQMLHPAARYGDLHRKHSKMQYYKHKIKTMAIIFPSRVAYGDIAPFVRPLIIFIPACWPTSLSH